MDTDEYILRKHEIHDMKERIVNIICDLNHADNCIVDTVKELLTKIEGNCLAVGEYYAEYMKKQEVANENIELIKMQKEWTRNNIKNDNERTAIAEEQLKSQKSGLEIQVKLLEAQSKDVEDNAKHRERLEKQNERILTATESIAYSLAKLTVNLHNLDVKKHWKNLVEEIGDTDYHDKIGD